MGEGDRWNDVRWVDHDREPLEPEVEFTPVEPSVLFGPRGEVIRVMHRHIGFRPAPK